MKCFYFGILVVIDKSNTYHEPMEEGFGAEARMGEGGSLITT